MNLRIATTADLPAMRGLMALAIDQLQSAFLSPAEIAARHAVMGLDSQLGISNNRHCEEPEATWQSRMARSSGVVWIAALRSQ